MCIILFVSNFCLYEKHWHDKNLLRKYAKICYEQDEFQTFKNDLEYCGIICLNYINFKQKFFSGNFLHLSFI